MLEIEAKLSNVQIIDPASLNADGKCVFGATIELEDLDEEKSFTYQIVGEDEAISRQIKFRLVHHWQEH